MSTTTKAAHTPGPWTFRRNEDGTCSVAKAGEYSPIQFVSVHHLFHSGDENTEANARLIAAAPEMLEALEDLIYSAMDGRVIPEWLDERLIAARAAIQKSRGGQ